MVRFVQVQTNVASTFNNSMPRFSVRHRCNHCSRTVVKAIVTGPGEFLRNCYQLQSLGRFQRGVNSSPVIEPVLDANLSIGRPSLWSIETYRFGRG